MSEESILDNIDLSSFIRPTYWEYSQDDLLAKASTDKFAAYELGDRYLREKDLDSAYHYFILATNLGDTDAPLQAALIANQQQRYSDAFPLFQKAVNFEFSAAEAHAMLGQYYYSGLVGEVGTQKQQAFYHFLESAKLGNPESQYSTAMAYYYGDGIQQSYQEYLF